MVLRFIGYEVRRSIAFIFCGFMLNIVSYIFFLIANVIVVLFTMVGSASRRGEGRDWRCRSRRKELGVCGVRLREMRSVA